jgi:hypothetical protein
VICFPLFFFFFCCWIGERRRGDSVGPWSKRKSRALGRGSGIGAGRRVSDGRPQIPPLGLDIGERRFYI